MAAYLGVPVRRGEIVRERVQVAEFADGSPITIPIVTIGGVEDGPTLYLQAGLHGDELTGIEVCWRAIAELDPTALAGTVVAVPIANVPAYLSRTRGWLHEERWMNDVNRFIPGSRGGLLSERLAHVLFNELVLAADFTIDFHSAFDGCDIAPFTYVWPNNDDHGTLAVRERNALAFGAPYTFYYDASGKFGTTEAPHGLMGDADLAGVATTIAEMGESRRISEECLPLGMRGVRNVLITMGMLEGEIVLPERQRRFDRFSTVHCDRGGGLRVSASLGDEVVAGQPIAHIVDVFGRTVEELVSPVDGFILQLMRLASVGTGAEVAWIGD